MSKLLEYPVVLIEYAMPSFGVVTNAPPDLCRLVQVDARRVVQITRVDGVWEDTETNDRLSVDTHTEMRCSDSLVERLRSARHPKPEREPEDEGGALGEGP